MNMSELMRMINGVMDESLLQRVKEEDLEQDVLDYFLKNDVNISNIFQNTGNSIYQYWYIDREIGVYVEINNLTVTFFETFEQAERIRFIEKHQQDNLSNANYEDFFMMIPTQFQMLDFKRRISSIPEENRYEIFKNIYTKMDFDFQEMGEDFLQTLFSLAPQYSDSTEEITIYRGMASQSTPLELAHSWTTKYSTALFFATRFSVLDGEIYRATIRKCDIIDYITDRNECEVLCNYEDVQNIEKLDSYCLDLDHLRATITNIRVILKSYVSKMKAKWYMRSDIHGINHAKRVMMFVYLLAKDIGYSGEEFEILMQAAMLHDIGRTEEMEETNHGQASVLKAKNLKLNPLNLSKENENVCHKIMAYHDVPDEQAKKELNSYTYYLLSILKDCDALDRVRIKDLDIEYLRFEESKNYPMLSVFLYQNNITKFL